MDTCQGCRYFRPTYFQVGRCDRQCNSHSKFFTDDGKAGILVHISFGCVQFEPQPDLKEETL